MKEDIDIYYFSGTGNTLLVVKEMIDLFKNRGREVRLIKIEKTNPKKIRTDRIIGLAFPVAFQSTFPFIWNFFHALPETDGTKVFMVDTMMSFSGAIVGPLNRALSRKGYNCIGAREIVMPRNWFPKKINEQENSLKVKKGLKEASTYAEDLLNGKAVWGRIPLLSDLLYAMCSGDYLMKNVNTAPGRKIRIDYDRCNRCGQCEKLCPTGNIKLDEFPRLSDHCETCMRCLSFCPSGAVYLQGKRFAAYKAVKAKELIKSGDEVQFNVD